MAYEDDEDLYSDEILDDDFDTNRKKSPLYDDDDYSYDYSNDDEDSYE